MRNWLEFFTTDNKSGWKCREERLAKAEPELHEAIVAFCDTETLCVLPFKRKIWHFIHSAAVIPTCRYCGAEMTFGRSIQEGYGKTFCSIPCANRDEGRKNKIVETNTTRFGGVSPSHSEAVKEKAKQTNIDRYGVENPFQLTDRVTEGIRKKYGTDRPLQNKEVMKRTKNTHLERYGAWYWATPKVREKSQAAVKEKYGVVSYFQTQEYKDRRLNRSAANVPEGYEFVQFSARTFTLRCLGCENIFDIPNGSYATRKNCGYNICIHCNPIGIKNTSKAQMEIEEFIENIGFEITTRDRKTLDGKELDILIPDASLAIEYNGIYYHSERFKPNDYHIKKTELCTQNGIELIHVFEDEWENKRTICESIIMNRLGQNTDRIPARKCRVSVITPAQSRDFLNENHIQGAIESKVRLGLFYSDELVAVMTFGGLRRALGSRSKEGSWELLRFAAKLNTSVMGGASKLFRHFINNYAPEHIISYSDIRWFGSSMYHQLGFESVGQSKPNYWYTNAKARMHRYAFRKDVLVKQGFDPNKTEHQIMLERGYYRIYDCGNRKFIWSKPA